jgi:UDP-GlcNAc3NAcA epimerase
MSDVFFAQMGIPREDHQLGVGSGTHGAMTARILESLEPVLLTIRPDAVLVFGDTNSTMAAALVAAKLNIPIAHIEAGMRSFNRRMPEEINRVVTDHLASWHYCATETAARNLAREGVTAGVVVTGDVMADAVEVFSTRAVFPPPGLEDLVPHGRDFSLVTCHRAENTDDPVRLGGILDGLVRIAAGTGMTVLFPTHPRTRDRLARGDFRLPDSILMLPPLSYLDMLALTARAALVLTDSGGLQKEAYLLGTPCVTLRDETEWVETVETGWNRLAGADSDAIVASAGEAIGARSRPRPNIFGDGRAAERIADHLLEALGTGPSFVADPEAAA